MKDDLRTQLMAVLPTGEWAFVENQKDVSFYKCDERCAEDILVGRMQVDEETLLEMNAVLLQPAPTAQAPKVITVSVEGGLVQTVTGLPSGFELHVEDHDEGDTNHPSWDEEKQCFVTIYDGEKV